MLKYLNAVKIDIVFAFKRVFYGWNVVYSRKHESWSIMKDGKTYCMDTKINCYKYVCMA